MNGKIGIRCDEYIDIKNKNNNMNTRKLLIVLSLLILIACEPLKKMDQNANDNAFLYKQAIQNSMYPEASKIDTNLIAINKLNKNLVWKNINGEDFILVVTWKQNVSYYKTYVDSTYYNTGKYPIWVTTAPELVQRMKQETYKDPNQRLKQLLGLPPNAVYSYFVEMWVKPEDMFRPCPDKEITDKKCDLCFPAKTDSAHIAWINNSRIERYYQCELYKQYPWSQLGYTYDWNPQNKSHIGLCEFVIGANKKIQIKAILPTEEYLKKE